MSSIQQQIMSYKMTASVPTVALHGSVYAQNSSVNVSSITAAGRLLVLHDVTWVNTTSVPAAVTPSGWTSIYNVFKQATWSIRTITSYKIAAGSETTVTGMYGAGSYKFVASFKLSGDAGIIPIKGITVNDLESIADTSTTSQTVMSSSAIPPAVVFGLWGGSSATSLTALAATGAVTLPAVNYNNKFGYKLINSASDRINATAMARSASVISLGSFYSNILY